MQKAAKRDGDMGWWRQVIAWGQGWPDAWYELLDACKIQLNLLEGHQRFPRRDKCRMPSVLHPPSMRNYICLSRKIGHRRPSLAKFAHAFCRPDAV